MQCVFIWLTRHNRTQGRLTPQGPEALQAQGPRVLVGQMRRSKAREATRPLRMAARRLSTRMRQGCTTQAVSRMQEVARAARRGQTLTRAGARQPLIARVGPGQSSH